MDIGAALQGMGAGFSGRGAEWAALQQQEQAAAEKRKQEDIVRRQQAMAQDARIGLYHLQNNNLGAFEKLATNRIELIKQQGENPSDTMAILDLAKRDPAAAIRELQSLDFEAVQRGLLPEQKPEYKSKGVQSSEILPDGTVITVLKDNSTSVIDSEGNELKGKARIEAIRQARQFGAEAQGERSAQREQGKLSAQLNLGPKLKGAVESAVAAAKQNAANSENDKSNERAFAVYEAAKSGLLSALSNASTGPISGWLPAITTNQQIAQGAIAAMAPTMKEMFRSSGEGTFTDSDQKVLMDMIPTRSDTQDTIKAKMENIDTIIRAKLGIGSGSVVNTPTENISKEKPIKIKFLGIE